jgi:hypothetical protein
VRRSKLESLTSHMDGPAPVPDGTTLVDLTDEEVRERADFSAGLFGFATDKVKEFVAQGCPRERDEEVRGHMTFALTESRSTFRGAEEWSRDRAAAVGAAIKAGALEGRPEDAPAVVMAAILVDMALKAEADFWAIVKKHAPRLAAAERGAEKLASRLH